MQLPPNLRPAAPPKEAPPPPPRTELRYSILVGDQVRSFFVEADGLLSPEQLLPHLQADIYQSLLHEEVQRLESVTSSPESSLRAQGDQPSPEV